MNRKQKKAVESLLEIIGIEEKDIKDSVRKFDSLTIQEQINFRTTGRKITDVRMEQIDPVLQPIQEQFEGSKQYRILPGDVDGKSIGVKDINNGNIFRFWVKGENVIGKGLDSGKTYTLKGVHDLKNMLLDEN